MLTDWPHWVVDYDVNGVEVVAFVVTLQESGAPWKLLCLSTSDLPEGLSKSAEGHPMRVPSIMGSTEGLPMVPLNGKACNLPKCSTAVAKQFTAANLTRELVRAVLDSSSLV